MLCPMRVFSAQKQAVHQRAFGSPSSIPLCDLRDLCAMLSPMGVFPAQSQAVHQRASAVQTSIPLCDLFYL
jgi:hypothetical protein